jgi:hypothetical protein
MYFDGRITVIVPSVQEPIEPMWKIERIVLSLTRILVIVRINSRSTRFIEKESSKKKNGPCSIKYKAA